MPLLERFIRLAGVFIEGRGLPFLGAGVSNNACIPSDRSIEPTVGWMIRELLKEACKRLCPKKHRKWVSLMGFNPSEEREIISLIGLQDGSKGENARKRRLKNLEKDLEKIAERISGQLGKFCEVLEQLEAFSHAEIVKFIKIKDFARLEPLPAHYYIAFLAQETLVNEVITTNYDCCIEKAVEYAMVGNSTEEKKDNSRAVSIFDLKSYRDHGARRLFPYNLAAVLRVYKINGCAGQLRNNPEYADSILLTERQLQHMDDRSCARDLLRDRARSRSLVFSGFGSDEPQVRFTVLRLLEEFSQSNFRAHDPKNAIWMHVFGSQRSFPQNQIMHGYWNRHNQDSSKEKIEEHTFSGNDVSKLHTYLGQELLHFNGGKLLADLFWQVVFQIVFLALMERYTRPPYQGWWWLADLDTPSRGVQRQYEFMKWLDPSGIGRAVLDKEVPTASKDCLKRIDAILGYKRQIPGISGDNKVEGIPLSLWLRCIEGRTVSSKDNYIPPECLYRSLLVHTKLIMSLLALWCFLDDDDEVENGATPIFGVKYPGNPTASPPLLYLSLRLYKKKIFLCSRLISDFTDNELDSSRCLLVAFVDYPAAFNADMPKRRFFERHDHIERLKVGWIVPIPVKDIIRAHLSTKQDSFHATTEEDPFMKFFVKIIVDVSGQSGSEYHMARLTRIQGQGDNQADGNDD